jgi:hypothetical protein
VSRRRCVICGEPLPLGSRADRRTDTATCRKALSRREGNGEDDMIETVETDPQAQLDALRAVVAEVADELDGRRWDGNPVRSVDDLVQRLRGAVEEA